MQKINQAHLTCVSEQLSDLILLFAVKFSKRFERHFNFELSPLQMHLLFYIHISGPQPISELCLCNKISKQQLTPILHKLIDENYIVKETNPRDRRSYLIKLTEQGNQYTMNLIKEGSNIIEKIVKQLSEEDYKAIGYHASALKHLMAKLPDADFLLEEK